MQYRSEPGCLASGYARVGARVGICEFGVGLRQQATTRVTIRVRVRLRFRSAPGPLLEDVDVREDGRAVKAPRPGGAPAAGGRRHGVKPGPAPTALHALHRMFTSSGGRTQARYASQYTTSIPVQPRQTRSAIATAYIRQRRYCAVGNHVSDATGRDTRRRNQDQHRVSGWSSTIGRCK